MRSFHSLNLDSGAAAGCAPASAASESRRRATEIAPIAQRPSALPRRNWLVAFILVVSSARGAWWMLERAPESLSLPARRHNSGADRTTLVARPLHLVLN